MRSLLRVMLTGLLLSGATSRALSADWRYFFTNFGNVNFFFDRAGVVHLSNGNVRAWEKEEWPAPDPKMGGETGLLWLIELDCKQRKYIFRDIRPIKGTVQSLGFVASMIPLYGGHWEFLGPNDLDDARYSQWCVTSPR
jgi:hypothetical protein